MPARTDYYYEWIRAILFIWPSHALQSPVRFARLLFQSRPAVVTKPGNCTGLICGNKIISHISETTFLIYTKDEPSCLTGKLHEFAMKQNEFAFS